MGEAWKEAGGKRGDRSRIFRQVVEMEIFWHVESDGDGYRDWEGEVRGAVVSADSPGQPGASSITAVEEFKSSSRGGGE